MLGKNGKKRMGIDFFSELHNELHFCFRAHLLLLLLSQHTHTHTLFHSICTMASFAFDSMHRALTAVVVANSSAASASEPAPAELATAAPPPPPLCVLSAARAPQRKCLAISVSALHAV